MKLNSEYAVALHRRGEGSAVIGARDLVGRVHRGVRVDKVEDAVFDTVEERPTRRDAIPADLRNGEDAVEFVHLAGEQAEAWSRSHLMRNVEEELMSDADAEERCAAFDGVADCVIDRGLRQPLHCGDEGSDSGEDELLCIRDRDGIAGDLDLRPSGPQRARDVGDVRDGGVDERRLHGTGTGFTRRRGDSLFQITPLVDGMSEPTTAFASRSAIAKALKIDSAAWCPLRPRIRSMWMLHAHLFANDLKNSSTSANGKSLWISSISRSMGTSKTRYGRPAKSTTTRASASSSGTYAWPKRRMPRLSPNACANASPRTRAVSSTVW